MYGGQIICSTIVLTPAAGLGAAGAYDLITLAQLKINLNITASDKDDLLQSLITDYSEMMKNEMKGRSIPIEKVQDTITLQNDPAYVFVTPNKEPLLRLSRFPIVTIDSLTENGNALVQDTDFRLLTAGSAIIMRLNNLQWCEGDIVVQYHAGYSTPPRPLQRAITTMARHALLTMNRDPYLKEDETAGIGRKVYWVPTTSVGGSFPPEVQDVLDYYSEDMTS